mgnify:CR=1 FL=1
MNISFTYFLLLVFIVVLVKSQNDLHSEQNSLIEQKIAYLNTLLKTRLVHKDQSFKFMNTWAKTKGLYESSVHINFLDRKNHFLANKLRNGPIPDINMFVTNFVLYSQL